MKFQAKHSLGQNFLMNQKVINDICRSVQIHDSEKILEIGPGKGYLTQKLKEFQVEVYAFEIDLDTKKYLDSLEDDKTHIIYQDFMKIALKDYFKENDSIHIIANIPYYITTPIIEKVIDSKLNVVDMTLMVQKEVAERLTAKPGSSDYGYISVYLNYFFELSLLFLVPKEDFDPTPKVDSAVIQLKKRKKTYQVNNEELFFQLIKDAFHLKRKNLRNNLKNYNLSKIEEVLNLYHFDLNARAEELSIEIFIDIANKITL